MNLDTNQFSTYCFREFKRFIGELTATAAGTTVAVNKTVDYLLKSDEKDPWSKLASEYNIKVDGLKSESIQKSIARLNLVAIYSGFDNYLINYRTAYYDILNKEWKAEKKDRPFDEFRRNVAFNELERKIDNLSDIINVIDHYRLIRNAIVHPSKKNRNSTVEFFKQENKSLETIKSKYKMVSAPNDLDNLNFHDIKLFSRILLDVLPHFDAALDPGNSKLKALIPVEYWAKFNNKRKNNAAIGYLKHNFGVSNERAKLIINGSLA